MINLMKKSVIAVAFALVATGAQAVDTTITNGTVTATINDKGTFASYMDPTTPGSPPMGSPGLSYKGIEVINIDNPSSWFWAKAGGNNYVSQYGSGGLAGTMTSGAGSVALTHNIPAGLQLLQTWSISGPDKLSVSVQLTNNTGSILTGVMWGVGFDPDQGGSTKNVTQNTILGQGKNAAVSALDTTYGTDLMVTLKNTTSASAYSIAAYINPWSCCAAVNPTTPFSALQAVGFSTYGDDSISLAYDLGSLGIGQTATLGYDYVFTQVPEPETYAMLLVGLGLLGFTARRRKSNSNLA